MEAVRHVAIRFTQLIMALFVGLLVGTVLLGVLLTVVIAPATAAPAPIDPASVTRGYAECGDTDAVPCVTTDDAYDSPYVLVISYDPYTVMELAECPEEDSPGPCVWVAGGSGNGIGGPGTPAFLVTVPNRGA